MKKIISVLLIIPLVCTFCSCGKNDLKETTSFSTEAKTSEATEKQESTSESQSESQTESAPAPQPMDKIKNTAKAIYGKNTGTNKTYTGLEPLPKVSLPVIDPDNLKGLSTAPHNHSFGVSKNGVPHEISVNNQAFYEKYGAICLDTKGDKIIYLTFDCGYENGCTQKILDTLKEKDVPAAFFVTLPNVKDNPEIIARMINEGHIVGNHSDTHPNFSKINRTQMAKEIENLDNYLREHFGYSSPFFRFPEGACSESALELVQSIGYTSVFWSSAYADWDTSNPKGKQYAFETVTSRLHHGCVLLLHAVSQDNADALGDIIDYAKEQGYEFKGL
ncbi:MAG: polysaccharide deacetylase family protein [Acutalibacteraceae bacterium]|nr:polysaccharide deacetylase family protein [Acutalibacteraceae bacterium]